MKASEGLSTAISRPGSPASSIASPPERFRLDGPTRALDPRTHAFRRDVADIALAATIFARRYAQATIGMCIAPSATLRGGADLGAPAVSQLLHGEGFAVLEIEPEWAWGRCLHDDYVGYLPVACLGPPVEPTHRIAVPLALVFARPDIKAPIVARWSFGAPFAGDACGDFLATDRGFVHRRHARMVDTIEHDAVAVAESLLGQPYLWGGRGAGGVDCSGLVQIALAAAGIAAPRDSDLQRAAVGEALADDVPSRRGDLIFFPGHVGLMVDGTRLIHANAHAMAVTVEPLADVIARLGDAPHPILARKRIAA